MNPDTSARIAELDDGITRTINERDIAQSKLEHARLALRLIADRTSDESAKNIALAALDVSRGATEDDGEERCPTLNGTGNCPSCRWCE